jgi:hypothetical protein
MITFQDFREFTEKLEQERIIPQREIVEQWLVVLREVCREKGDRTAEEVRSGRAAPITDDTILREGAVAKFNAFKEWARQRGDQVEA